MITARRTYERTDAQNQALHMVLLQYTTIEGNGALAWLEMALDEWHQDVICTVEDINDAMQYMESHYWTNEIDFDVKVVA